MDKQDGLTQRELEEMKEAFEFFDRNGDGTISHSELGKVLRALGQNPTEKCIAEVMQKADKNGNKVLEYQEYVDLLQDYVKDPAVVEIELREAFRVFDKDRNNSLDFNELRKALMYLGEPLTEKETAELCKMMDTNGDNKVDIDEFVKYMCQRC